MPGMQYKNTGCREEVVGVSLVIGIIGSVCVLIAWLFEAVESVREHKALVDLRFSSIYLAGIAILTVYSIMIKDPVYMFLNASILILVVCEIFYTLLKINR